MRDQDVHELADHLMDLIAKGATVETALIEACRSGWPGMYLSKDKRQELLKEWMVLAKPLWFSRDRQTISIFCNKAAETLLSKLPRFALNRPSQKSLAQKPGSQEVKAAVEKEMLVSDAGFDVSHRVALRLFNDHKREQKTQRQNDNDKLKYLLSLPKNPAGPLPKNDIRSILMKVANRSSKTFAPVMELLNQAAPFSPRLLKSVLGSQLYATCKPVGFFDRHQQVLLIETDSSARAHELNFRKGEILRRLQTIEAFSRLQDIRFSIKPQGLE